MTDPCRPHVRSLPVWLFLALTLTAVGLGCRSMGHRQVADAEFDPTVRRPAVAGRTIRVVVDEAHGNFHTADGRYRPFAELLRSDGFTVERGQVPLTSGALDGVDVLVIANAELPDPTPDQEAPGSAFTAEEVAAVDRWVRDGGGLLLIADHTPFGLAARELAAAFGVVLHDEHLRDRQHADEDLKSPYVLVFERADGLIADHAITRGRGPDEAVDRVVTFGGEALEGPPGATPLLRLDTTAEIVDDPDRGEDAAVRSAAGMAQAVALAHGRGRVVVVGEAAVFTSQVLTGRAADSFGREELRIGMSRTDTDDRQLALNTVRWLAGLL
jgi:hypothetical protein